MRHQRLAFFCAFFLSAMLLSWSGCSQTTPGDEPNNKQETIADTSGGNDASTTEVAADTTEPTPDAQTPVDTPAPDDNPPQEADPPEPPPVPATYHKDVRAILESSCNGCHKKGGIGPILFNTYTLAKAQSGRIAKAVSERIMPPWLADQSCISYKHDRSLPQEQIDKIMDWFKNGTPEGDEKDYVAPTPKELPKLERVDTTVTLRKPYTPLRAPDDYRCFVMNWAPTTSKYVTGFEVKPGNHATVHHAVIYLVSPKDAAQYDKLETQSSTAGYRCFGTPGGESGIPVILGAWAPGMTAINYPKDTGIPVEPGSRVVLQIHYNTVPNTSVDPDQTSIDFKLADKVIYSAAVAPLVDPLWLFGSKKMPIPANQKDIKHEYTIDPAIIIGEDKNLVVHGIAMHMHLLASSGRIEVRNVNTKKNQCLVNIPRWDFGWQISYLFQKPFTMGPGDRLYLQCMFDNTKDNQPIIDGTKATPVDVYWGSGTGDEMCMGFLYLTCTDKKTGEPKLCFKL